MLQTRGDAKHGGFSCSTVQSLFRLSGNTGSCSCAHAKRWPSASRCSGCLLSGHIEVKAHSLITCSTHPTCMNVPEVVSWYRLSSSHHTSPSNVANSIIVQADQSIVIGQSEGVQGCQISRQACQGNLESTQRPQCGDAAD